MSATEAGVLITFVLALVAVFAFFLFRQRAKVKMKGLGGASIEVDASNTPAPAIRAEDVKSRRGGLDAQDDTGRGIEVKKVDVETDIRVRTHSQPPKV